MSFDLYINSQTHLTVHNVVIREISQLPSDPVQLVTKHTESWELELLLEADLFATISNSNLI